MIKLIHVWKVLDVSAENQIRKLSEEFGSINLSSVTINTSRRSNLLSWKMKSASWEDQRLNICIVMRII